MKKTQILKCYYKIKFLSKFKRKRYVKPTDEEVLDMHISKHASQSVFIHAGLSGIGNSNATEWIIKKFSRHFENILAPGFTPSFRKSGIYHKLFSVPEYGLFSKQFLSHANYRTDDPIHSILVHGDYSFEGYNHCLSFGYDSCFEKLDDDNMLIVNIGTFDIVFAQLHHIEKVYEVPYLADIYHRGTIYYNETKFSRVIQRNYAYKINKLKWNRKKICRDLLNDGILKEYNLNGLIVRFFRAQDMRDSLSTRIINDPYYLVT